MVLPCSDDDLYAALLARDPAYDGLYFVGVRTTGIFCRLTCPARKPRRRNVSFFERPADAEAAGFRACRRCRPLEPRAGSAIVDRLRGLVVAEPARRWTTRAIEALGYEAGTVRRAFRREYGLTFVQFARAHRLGQVLGHLEKGASVIDAQLDAGYESASGFREAINRLLGRAPAQVRGLFALQAQWIETPIGPMLAVADHEGLHLLEFADRTALPRELERLLKRGGPIRFGPNAVLDRVANELARYFDGRDPVFTVPVIQRGSAFERSVWAALQQVPAGQTRSYAELARAIGRPTAVRAAGRANGANQVAIIIPCHRIIGRDGALVGYGGKIWRKRWLLEHERRLVAIASPASDAA